MGRTNPGQHLRGIATAAASDAIKKELRRDFSDLRTYGLFELDWHVTAHDDKAELEATVYANTIKGLHTFGSLIARLGDGTFHSTFGDFDFEALIRLGDLTVRLRTFFAADFADRAESIIREAIGETRERLEALR